MSTLNLSDLKISRNVEMNDDELRAFAEKCGDLLHWDFGPIMEMKYQQNAQNYLFSDEQVPLHWDGAFYKEPRKLLFYCTHSEGEGGETIFLNTCALWDSLTKEEQELCKKVTLTYTTEKKAHYGGEIHVPLVQVHPESGKTILRMAERVETKLNPVELKIEGVDCEDAFYSWMKEKINDERFRYIHEWKKGDLLIVDNHVYLHGRNPLRNNRARTFKRIQIL